MKDPERATRSAAGALSAHRKAVAVIGERRWPSPRWLMPAIAVAVLPLPATLALAAALLSVACYARARNRRRSDPSVTAGQAAGTVTLGRDGRGRPVTLAEGQLGAHALILGASGSGKSTTLTAILGQQIRAGRGVVAIDLKGSAELAGALASCASAAGRPLRVWSLDGQERWNPLAQGNPTELKDRLIGTERFSEPHYLRAAERYLQLALQVHAATAPGIPATLPRVVELLDPRRLAEAGRRLPAARAAQLEDYLRGLGRDQLSAVRGLQSRLAVISESHLGPLLTPTEEGDGIDLRRALDGAAVVLFSLNASAYGSLAAQVGTLALQDLISAAGARERRGGPPVPATVAIDEFSGLRGDQVLGLIARGRSAGVSVLLATQELADLDRVARGFRHQVLGSTAVKIAHRQDVGDSARAVAELTGVREVWEESVSRPAGRFPARASVRVTAHPVRRPQVEAARIQALATGEALVITKVPAPASRLTRIAPLAVDRADRAGARGRARGC
jgi:conjugal transfer pilus assembly protein TraD